MMLGFHFLCQKTFRNFLPPQLMSTIKQVPHGYIEFQPNQPWVLDVCNCVVLIIFNGGPNALEKIPSPPNNHGKLCNIVKI